MATFKQALATNRQAVLDLSNPSLRKTLPVLYEIRAQTAKSLADYLKAGGKAESYSIHRHRALLAQLNDTIDHATKGLSQAMLDELQAGVSKVGPTSLRNLKSMVEAGDLKFRGAVTPLHLPHAQIIGDFKRTVMSKYDASAKRYGTRIGRAIRRELMVGTLKGGSITDVAKSLMGVGYEKAAKKGPSAVAKGIADKRFFKNLADAERLVRTEQNNAYNQLQVEALVKADEDDPGWMKQWDAANDMRTCEACFRMDGEIVGLHENFSCGHPSPPLHPNDRCSIVPWRPGWPKR